MSKYNSHLIRRRVRRAQLVKGQQHFKTKSFTRNDETHWLPVVDLEAGTVFCDCPDFRFRHAKHEPTVNDSVHHCKHITRALTTCVRVGQLQPVAVKDAAPVLVPAPVPAAPATPLQEWDAMMAAKRAQNPQLQPADLL